MSELKRRLMLWSSGVERVSQEHRLRTSAEVAVLEDGRYLADLENSGAIDKESVVFAPVGSPDGATTAEVVEYSGDCWGETDEFALGESFILQSISYGTMRFVPAFGPTVVRIDSEEDLAAFVHDADEARTTGSFATFLKHPMNRLGDQAALGASTVCAGPTRRIHVTADGECSTSPAGLPLGQVGSSLLELRAAWVEYNQRSDAPCSVALGKRIDEASRTAALRERPWLGDYLDAIEVLQHGEARGITSLKVSGYGDRLSPALGVDEATSQRHGPIVAWNDECCFVHDIRSSRSMTMSIALGRLVDLLAWSSSLEEAQEYAEPEVLRSVGSALTQHGLSLDLAGSVS